MHPWVQRFYPVLGLGSGERLLWHFQAPLLYWINFSLRLSARCFFQFMWGTWETRKISQNTFFFCNIDHSNLKAQQRYVSYRAILVAIVSQNPFVCVCVCVCVFTGYRTITARYVATWGIAQMCLCETKCQGGGITPF